MLPSSFPTLLHHTKKRCWTHLLAENPLDFLGTPLHVNPGAKLCNFLGLGDSLSSSASVSLSELSSLKKSKSWSSSSECMISS
ncbi:hypothetical protein Mapa_005722 [Marchantia paleacea]|nr:hypothetical protein Mapa_005722 [Marchantia paleacea]